MPSVNQMRSTVESYLELVGGGTAEEITALYTDDALLEDPVGSDPKRGRDAILEFYKVIEPIERSTELLSFKAGGDTAVFAFRIVTVFGDITVELEPTDIMVFADDGRIASMRAVWSPDDMVQRTSA